MSEGRLLHLRCFLEGVEVPIVSCTVSAAIGGSASASIEVPDSEEVFKLLPRTIVHVFFLDDKAGEITSDPDLYSADKAGIAGSISSEYKLLFCGEVFSVYHSKSGFGGRNANMMCLDFSNILDTSYIYQISYSDPNGALGIGSASEAQFSGAASATINPFDNIINTPQQIISSLINSPALSELHKDRTSKLGGLLRILELLLGVESRALGLNIWTSVHERIVRLLDMITADTGETAANLFNQSVFDEWLKGQIGEQNQSLSYREILSLIMGYIYYELVPNPTASYFKAAGPSIEKGQMRVPLQALPPPVSVPVVTEEAALEQTTTDPNSATAPGQASVTAKEYRAGYPTSPVKQYFKSNEKFLTSNKIDADLTKVVMGTVAYLRETTNYGPSISDAFRTSKDASGIGNSKSPHTKGLAYDIVPARIVGEPPYRESGHFSMGIATCTTPRNKIITKDISRLFGESVYWKVTYNTTKRINEKTGEEEWLDTLSTRDLDIMYSIITGTATTAQANVLLTMLFGSVENPYHLIHHAYITYIHVTKDTKNALTTWSAKFEQGTLFNWLFDHEQGGKYVSTTSLKFLKAWITGASNLLKADGMVMHNGYLGGMNGTLSGMPRDQRDVLAYVWQRHFKMLKVWFATLEDAVTRAAAFNNVKGIFTGVTRKVMRGKSPPVWAIIGIAGDDPVHIQIDKASKVAPKPPTAAPPSVTDIKASTTSSTTAATADVDYSEVDEAVEHERMSGFILRPDIWMCAPPACNIIFPEEIVSINISRELMMQTTRAFLMTFDTMYADQVVLSNYYYAPAFESVENIGTIALGYSNSFDVLYPHEVFTGIIPKISRTSELAFYSRAVSEIGENPRAGVSLPTNENLTQEQSIAAVVDSGGSLAQLVQQYATNVAHYNLLKQRYSANRLSVTTKFLPRLINGFPAVVIGKNNEYDDFTTSSHTWLGMISSVQHSVHQGGASTTIGLGTCRPYNTGSESIDELLKLKVNGKNLFKHQNPNYVIKNVAYDNEDSTTVSIDYIKAPSDDVNQFSLLMTQSSYLNGFGTLTPASLGAIHSFIDSLSVASYIQAATYSYTLDGNQISTLKASRLPRSTLYAGLTPAFHWMYLDAATEKAVFGTNTLNKLIPSVPNSPVPMYIKAGAPIQTVSAKSGKGATLTGLEVTDAEYLFTLVAHVLPLFAADPAMAGIPLNVNINDDEQKKRIVDSFIQKFSNEKAALLQKINSARALKDADPLQENRDVIDIIPLISSGPVIGVWRNTYKYLNAKLTGVEAEFEATDISLFETDISAKCKLKVEIYPEKIVIELPMIIPFRDFTVVFATKDPDAVPAPEGDATATNEENKYIPLEEALMPAWIDKQYKNGEVTASGNIDYRTGIGALYRDWFGCPSIVELAIKASDSPYSTVTIEEAVNKIVETYSGFDKHSSSKLIYNMTARNHATLKDMLGPISKSELTSVNIPKTGGFHSRSVGNYDKLELLGIAGRSVLASSVATTEVAIPEVSDDTVNKGLSIDPRNRRRQRVIAYKQSIIGSKGKLG